MNVEASFPEIKADTSADDVDELVVAIPGRSLPLSSFIFSFACRFISFTCTTGAAVVKATIFLKRINTYIGSIVLV